MSGEPAYVQPMLVYGTSERFHRQDCFTVKWMRHAELKELTADIGLRPCARCFPDVPRIKTLHRPCARCGRDQVRPCRHNGGVLVLTKFYRKPKGPADPGGSVVLRKYVWPENAHLYELADCA